MRDTHYISSAILDLATISKILQENKLLALSEESRHNINVSRAYLDNKIEGNSKPFYGINTGFGSLCNVAIKDEHLTQLQENLMRSHACGTGDYVPKSIVKLMILLKVQSLSYGHSGVHIDTVERLIDFYNLDILPVVYTQGSLGASGDLAPLAHLSLPLIGEGMVWEGDEPAFAKAVLERHQLRPIQLKSKEGLALLNGTQFMVAYGLDALLKCHKLSYLADMIGAISIDAFNCNLSPFDSLVHYVRPHRGQIKTAERIQEFLADSEIAKTEKENVQDPYSFRCIPQVHGATKDAALDFLAIAMAEIGSISERRTYQLISGLRDLPPFLVDNPGLHSGMMIPQYTAASIVSQNKQLATPASVDSIVSSNGQEDHVSMGANAATKLYKVVENIETILAIELLNASQALHFRAPSKTSPFLESIISAYRTEVPFATEDRIFSTDIHKTKEFMNSIQVDTDMIFR